MSQLAFFPWFTTAGEIRAGKVHLLPYSRARGPSTGEEQSTIDAVLEPYKQLHNAPIKTCTIVTMGDRGLTDDFSEAELDELFRYGEAVAFAGLSRRKYFDSLSYANRDNFRLVVQSFSEPMKGVAVRTRRRDGFQDTGFSAKTFRANCPHHVQPDRLDLDLPLLEALLASEPEEDWPEVLQAIVLFNEANTDRDFVPEAAELMLTYAAFEQLLEVRADTKTLATRFEAEWQPYEDLGPDNWQGIQPPKRAQVRWEKASTLRCAWLEDMGITRGSLAHGYSAEDCPSIWSPREHLLLAAFAFPLLVKLRLCKRGRYTLSRDDLAGIDAFESLVGVRHFEGGKTWQDAPWLKILGRAMMHRFVIESAEEFFGGQA